MKLTLLGTGSPTPDPNRQGPAVLVQAAEDYLLFDAGRGVCNQLIRIGLMPEELDSIFFDPPPLRPHLQSGRCAHVRLEQHRSVQPAGVRA